ncbi:MAG: EI24 domain-containing protein [Rhodocyclaceae bacterium]
MNSVFVAYTRALRSLMRPDIFWHLLWPSLLAFAIWIGVAVFFWADASAALIHMADGWPLVGNWFAHEESGRVTVAVVVNVLLFMLAVPLVFVTSAILVSIFALPMMLERVARTDYSDLEERRGGTITGSLFNSLWALVVFLVVAGLTLPFWLIPGVGLVLSVLLSAWLNQRCYRYDALMNHADKAELRDVPRRRKGGVYALGIGAGVLAFVPFLNLFVPAFTGLAFVHYLLEGLRRDRRLTARAA